MKYGINIPSLKHLATIGLFTCITIGMSAPAAAVSIKNVGHFDGVRPNQLIGYGLVVGLGGTGDTRRTTFTPQSIQAMLSRMGIRIDGTDLTLRNVAAVMVTAELAAFAKPGATMDVTVSSIGDARSLKGGTLLLTPLNGADNNTYAVAQGAMKVGTSAISRSFRSGRMNENVGRIPGGASVERGVRIQLGRDGKLTFLLGRPDFTTAVNVAATINSNAGTISGAAGMARAVDGGTVEIQIPEAYAENVATMIGRLENLNVPVGSIAKVVVNGRTGAVVLGGGVTLSASAIAYEGLTVEILGIPALVNTPNGPVAAEPEALPTLQAVGSSATLSEVVAGLNALGLKPAELIDILEALSASGALHAELEVQ